MIRYLRPDSSERSRRSSVAHSTYSGIDSSSKPRNSVTRFVRGDEDRHARGCENSSRLKNSPGLASCAACERHASSTAPMPAPANANSSDEREVVGDAARPRRARCVSPNCQIAEADRGAERGEREQRRRVRGPSGRARARRSSVSSAPPVEREERREAGVVDVRRLGVGGGDDERAHGCAPRAVGVRRRRSTGPAARRPRRDARLRRRLASASARTAGRARARGSRARAARARRGRRTSTSRESTLGPTRLCIARMNARST